jgi:hypothetical protein
VPYTGITALCRFAPAILGSASFGALRRGDAATATLFAPRGCVRAAVAITGCKSGVKAIRRIPHPEKHPLKSLQGQSAEARRYARCLLTNGLFQFGVRRHLIPTPLFVLSCRIVFQSVPTGKMLGQRNLVP